MFDRSNDLAVTFTARQKDFMLLNKEELNLQMKQWRELAKQGRLIIRECNNVKLNDDDNSKWYVFVVQNTDEEKNNMDMFGMFILSVMVRGYVYAFKSKTNRDTIRDYVMKGITVVE
jgi:hypothetical protein